MYKIVHREGYEVESGFGRLEVAVERLSRLRSLGAKNVYVVDASTRIGKRRKRSTSSASAEKALIAPLEDLARATLK
jgi:hypothetical protein